MMRWIFLHICKISVDVSYSTEIMMNMTGSKL